MTNHGSRFDEAWAALLAQSEKIQGLSDIFDIIDKIDDNLKDAEVGAPSTYRLPYSGAEPAVDLGWN